MFDAGCFPPQVQNLQKFSAVGVACMQNNLIIPDEVRAGGWYDPAASPWTCRYVFPCCGDKNEARLGYKKDSRRHV